MTGSDTQLYNGVVLMTTFFGSRLVWGAYNCFRVFPDMLRALEYQKTAEGKAWLAEQRARATVDATATAALEGGEWKEIQMARMTAPRVLPLWIAVVYLGAYVVLMALNVVWFGKMIETIRARFDPPLGTRKVKEEKKEEPAKAEISGVKTTSASGNTVVELEEMELTQRSTRSKA